MKVGAAIYSLLVNDSAVSAIVGTRIYPELAEEGASAPYIVYSVVSNTPSDTKDGTPIDEAQLEIFSVGSTYAAANDLADKVRAALDRKSQIVVGTVTVQSIQYTNEVVEVSEKRDLYISVQDYTTRITR
jgi:ABC-type molybdate transport system substrate-binding protein